MSKHRIKDMSLDGREGILDHLPEFDFYNLGRVRRLAVEEREDGLSADMLMTATYEEPGGEIVAEIGIQFRGIRYVKLPALTPSFYLEEIEVEDIRDDQQEGVKYRTKSYGETDFEVLSEHVSLGIIRIY